MKMATDMTEGKALPIIVRFFIPLFLGNLFQQFYNMMDTVIVGKFLGVNALAGVGATTSMNFLILGFTMGITGGFGVVLSQQFGAKDYEGLRRYIANSLYLAIMVSVILTPLTVGLCKRFLTALRTPQDILPDSYAYISVILGGIPVTMLYNSAASILRSIGDSRTPLIVLVAASFLNIILDVLFITVFKMGTEGAAVATVIAQALAAVGCLFYSFRRYEVLKMKTGEWKLEWKRLRHLAYIGVPMGVQFSVTAIGSVCVQFAVNALGSVCVAAYTAGSKLRIMFTCGMDMAGMAVSTFSGQNIGAGKKERVNRGVGAGIFLAMVIAAVSIFALRLGGRTMATWFVDKSDIEVIDKMVYYMNTTVMFTPLLAVLYVLRSTIQGIGFSMMAMFAGLFELAGRCAIAFGMFGKVTYPVICYADPSAWLMADILLVSSYLYICKKLELPGLLRRQRRISG